jgi:hypothetical protein
VTAELPIDRGTAAAAASGAAPLPPPWDLRLTRGADDGVSAPATVSSVGGGGPPLTAAIGGRAAAPLASDAATAATWPTYYGVPLPVYGSAWVTTA